MSAAFKYRPKFVDIRVRPPAPEEEAGAPEADVFTLKPGERPCDHAGCRRPADARAPKHRDLPGEFYWFCTPHAAEYNKSWDFFAGMSEGELKAYQEDALTGHRPTWSFKADSRSRESAAFAAKMGTVNQKPGWDPFGLFGRGAKLRPQDGPSRRLGRMERSALADLDLEDDVEPAAIQARYKLLLKRLHPDSNGGDRSTEPKLQRVLKAFRTLRAAGLV